MDAGRQAVDVVGTEGSERKISSIYRKVKKSELFYKRYSVPIFSFYLLALSPGWPLKLHGFRSDRNSDGGTGTEELERKSDFYVQEN